MKHNLETLKYKMERFPETIIPYDYLVQMIAELHKEPPLVWIKGKAYIEVKELLGNGKRGKM